MWHGLRVLNSTAKAMPHSPVAPPARPAAATGTLDRQFVRLLADMVLATQLEVQHAH
jgi:hypothetical protein